MDGFRVTPQGGLLERRSMQVEHLACVCADFPALVLTLLAGRSLPSKKPGMVAQLDQTDSELASRRP